MNKVHRRHPRGAALMAALLLTLVLSGVGIVVMQSTMMSMKMSGNYKMRKQASAAAEAAVLFSSNMVGDRASTFWRGIDSSTQLATGAGATSAAQLAAVRRGGAMILTRGPLSAMPPAGVPVMQVMTNAAANETGLFSNAGAIRSFEQRTGTGSDAIQNSFRVVLRDPVEGPPAPGYSGRFCFKKIYFASESKYGSFAGGTESADWTLPPSTIATGRNGMEGFIGPIECGAR